MIDEDQNIIVSIDNKYVFGDQLYQRIYRLVPIPVVNNSIFSNIEMITYKLMEIINNFLSEFHNKMDRISINLTLLHGEEIANINLDRNINIENLIMLLVNRLNAFHNSYTDEEIFLNSLRFFILKQKKSGGCNNFSYDICETRNLNKIYNRYFALPEELNNMSDNFHKYKIINYKSKNNNFGLVCIIKATGNTANRIKPDLIRKKYNIEKKYIINS